MNTQPLIDNAEARNRHQAAQASSPLDLPTAVFTEALERRKANRAAMMNWIREALKEGTDYGKIHSVGKKNCRLAAQGKAKECIDPAHYSKPCLFKPGAEKICGMLGVTTHFPTLSDYEAVAIQDTEIKTIILRCELKDASGRIVAEGVGGRTLAQDYGDINKALKMCQKSAMIDACLRMAGLSEVFTQDIDVMVLDEERKERQERNRTYKNDWQRQERNKFRDENGYSQSAHYDTGKNRKVVLERDGYACVVCGMTDEQHKAKWNRPITVDHISKDRSDNRLENLQTLCLSCHGAKDISPELIEPKVPHKKQEILAMRAEGKTYQAIADITGFSIGAVWKWCQRWADEQIQDNLSVSKPPALIAKNQLGKLRAAIQALALDEARVLAWCQAKWGIKEFMDLTFEQWRELVGRQPLDSGEVEPGKLHHFRAKLDQEPLTEDQLQRIGTWLGETDILFEHIAREIGLEDLREARQGQFKAIHDIVAQKVRAYHRAKYDQLPEVESPARLDL